MTNARIERLTSEVKADPIFQFYDYLFIVAGRIWPRAQTSPQAEARPQADARSQVRLSLR